MHSHFLSRFTISTLLAVAALPAVANAGQLKMDCPDSGVEHEAKLIQQRQAGAVFVRSKRHLARIKSGAGWLEFKDKGPHDEQLSGLHHYFCDLQGDYLLLSVQDEDRFTGKLVHLPSGRITQAGHQVILSPDRRAYFAVVQPNGLDGSEWMIYASDGRLSWQGFDFIPKENVEGLRAYAYLSEPRWLAHGEFSAQASCDGDTSKGTWQVKLIKNGGQWDWQPRRKCAKK